MKINVCVATIIILLFLASNASAQEASTANLTMGEFTATVPIQMAQPLVSYCSEEIPESKKEFEDEFSVFKAKFSEAIKPIMWRLASNPEFSKPVSEDYQKEFSQINASVISDVKKLDPHTYCPAMLVRMRSATVEALRVSVEASLARYESTSKADTSK